MPASRSRRSANGWAMKIAELSSAFRRCSASAPRRIGFSTPTANAPGLSEIVRSIGRFAPVCDPRDRPSFPTNRQEMRWAVRGRPELGRPQSRATGSEIRWTITKRRRDAAEDSAAGLADLAGGSLVSALLAGASIASLASAPSWPARRKRRWARSAGDRGHRPEARGEREQGADVDHRGHRRSAGDPWIKQPRDLVKITPRSATPTAMSARRSTPSGVGFSDISLGGRSTVAIYTDEAPIPFAIETRA